MDGDVMVIGAGPGGCATACLLQRAGWQVVLVERQPHPVDKLCGEFVSPEGVESLARLGIDQAILSQLAAPHIQHVLLSTLSGRTWQSPLPHAGLGLSRRCMDTLLIERCRELGVHVLQGLHVREVNGNFTHGFYLRARMANGVCGQLRTRLAIGAFGKRSMLQRKLQPQTTRTPHDLMALKCYGRPGYVPERIEIHAFPDGYVGMSEVEGNKTNLCLLTKASAFRRADGDMARFGEAIMSQNPLLAQRLADLRPDWPSALAVANLAFGSRSRVGNHVLMVGDAAAAITPLCGDGMSMALQSAELLAPLAHRFLSGDLDGTPLCRSYERRWRRRFHPRLRVGQGLQPLFLNPAWGEIAMTGLNWFPGIGRQLIRWTRG